MRIEEIKLRLEKATPGPWIFGIDSNPKLIIGPKGSRDVTIVVFDEKTMKPNDAELICNSPSDISYLLEQNQRLVEALEKAKEYIKYMEEAGEREVGQCRSFEKMLDDNVVNEVYHVVVKALQDYK